MSVLYVSAVSPHDVGTLEETFIRLYERHYDEIYAFCARRVGSIAAEDACSDVFTTVWRRLGKLDLESERGWLFGVARNVLRNHRRSLTRRFRLVDRLKALDDGRSQHLDAEPIGNLSPGVAKSLRALSDSDRELLQMSAWDGLSNSEIAVALGISANSVNQRLLRARRRFAAHLDRHSGPEHGRSSK